MQLISCAGGSVHQSRPRGVGGCRLAKQPKIERWVLRPRFSSPRNPAQLLIWGRLATATPQPPGFRRLVVNPWRLTAKKAGKAQSTPELVSAAGS